MQPYNPKHWCKPEHAIEILRQQPKAGHPPAGAHVPVRTTWDDRQPSLSQQLDEGVFDAAL